MSKRPREPKVAKSNQQLRTKFPFGIKSWVLIGVSTATVAICVAAGANDILHGQVKVEPPRASILKKQDPGGINVANTAKPDNGKDSEALLEKYGAAANSPAVATAIRKAESNGFNTLQRSAGAKEASDRAAALEHGYLPPGTDQTTAIMYGFVPPGMSAEQAAIIGRNLPRLGRARSPITPEMADRMAGLPPEPQMGMPQGESQRATQAANRTIIQTAIRERFGPVDYMPRQFDHNWLARHATRTANGFVVDHQVSLISPEYAYDGGHGSVRELTDSSGNLVATYGYDPYGRQTKLSGTGVEADFGYEGYYVHQRSGLNLAVHRAYTAPALFPNSASGRFRHLHPPYAKNHINVVAIDFYPLHESSNHVPLRFEIERLQICQYV